MVIYHVIVSFVLLNRLIHTLKTLEMKADVKKFPLIAGMKYTPTTGEITQSKMSVVGYRWVKFIYDSPAKDCLISEREIKRQLN